MGKAAVCLQAVLRTGCSVVAYVLPGVLKAASASLLRFLMPSSQPVIASGWYCTSHTWLGAFACLAWPPTDLELAATAGWDMTLVLLACLPFLAAVGAALGKMTGRMESKAATAYAAAGDIAQQSLQQVGWEGNTACMGDRAARCSEIAADMHEAGALDSRRRSAEAGHVHEAVHP
jgi:hypothetical protein